MANANEVGTIGQMYEHRKTHKAGVLESRDEKFKTLMFRDAEGKSFNVTYSTFHSAWRKYAGDASIQTSTQKEEEKSQKKEKAVKAEKTVKEKAKKPVLSQKEKVQMVMAIKDIVENVLEEKKVEGQVVKVTYRGAITIKCRRRNAIEIWVKYDADTVDVYVTDKLALDKDLSYIIATKTKDTWVLKTRYTVAKKDLADLMKHISVKFKAYASEINKELKSKKKEEKVEED